MRKAILLTITISSLAAAEIEKNNVDFYSRKSEGWFFYNELLAADELNKNATPHTSPEEQIKIPNIDAAWMRENLPKYKDAAWNNPTLENMRAFLYLQRFALDGSNRFAEVAEMTVTGDRFLDETIRRPETTAAIQQIEVQAGLAKEQILQKLAQKYGLFFFFNGDCQQSQLQATILSMLEEKTKFFVLPISLDWKKLQGKKFQNTRFDQGQGKTFGVVTAPAIFLVSAQGEFSAIGHGVMSLQELEHRILVTAHRELWISSEEYASTKPVLHTNTCEYQQKTNSGLSAAVPIPPNALINYLQKLQQRSADATAS